MRQVHEQFFILSTVPIICWQGPFLELGVENFLVVSDADPGFWSGGPSGVLTPRGAMSPKFAQNRGFLHKIA